MSSEHEKMSIGFAMISKIKFHKMNAVMLEFMEKTQLIPFLDFEPSVKL